MEKIEEKIKYHQLYDIYKDLLTAKQQLYFEYYYLDDYSLSEIAQLLQVSRNAVFEQIKIAISHLDRYEEVLHNYQNKVSRQEIIMKLKQISAIEEQQELINQLEKIEV